MLCPIVRIKYIPGGGGWIGNDLFSGHIGFFVTRTTNVCAFTVFGVQYSTVADHAIGLGP